jgi:hypothetical protein
MAIDRGPWNALVDDDGSNLVGSIWNKAAIKTVILDPADAAYSPAWVAMPFFSYNFIVNSGTGTWTVAAGDLVTFAYLKVGAVTHVQIYIAASTLSSTPNNLGIILPAAIGTPRYHSKQAITIMQASASAGVGHVYQSDTKILIARDLAGTPFASGNLIVAANLTIAI